MGLGLVVGVAALGVIAARSVVERRQQIGVLRAIGFQRATVRLGFLLESGFLAFTSIVVGSGLGLLMSYNVVDDARRQATWPEVALSIPWLNLIVVFTIVMLVALGTTYLPARRACRRSTRPRPCATSSGSQLARTGLLGENSTGRRLMPLMKFERRRSGPPAYARSGMRSSSSL